MTTGRINQVSYRVPALRPSHSALKALEGFASVFAHLMNQLVTEQDANPRSASASLLLMLWHLSPSESKQKIFTKVKVPLGPPILLVTRRPPGMAVSLILAGYPIQQIGRSYQTMDPMIAFTFTRSVSLQVATKAEPYKTSQSQPVPPAKRPLPCGPSNTQLEYT